MSPSVHNGLEKDDPTPGFSAANGHPPQTLKLSGNGPEGRNSRAEITPESNRVQDRRPLSQQLDRPDGPLNPHPPERDTRLSSPTKRKRSLDDDAEGEDEEEDEENGGPSAQMGNSVATSQYHASAGVDQYVPVPRRGDEAVGRSRNGRHPDGSQPPESANGYSSASGYTQAGVQVDKSKRKRQFGKRTKTGCATCRRRKKKCDEAKPTCNNCIRGGLHCEGYPLKSAWQKPGASNSHPPLQSKFGYAEHPAILPRPATETFLSSRQPMPLEESRSRPLLVEDERTSTHSSSPWQSRSSIMGSLPQSPHRSSEQPILTVKLVPQEQHHHHHQMLRKSEKEKMLGGSVFNSTAPELRIQRDECKRALYNFNHAIGTGADSEEQTKRFWKVLQPPHTEKLSRTIHPKGVMGDNCLIDQPFQCEYGFNLRIGKNVVIGKDCLIEDVAEVVIGDDCKLGPRVSITTMEWSRSAQDRQGPGALATAKPVIIESNVTLGANVQVLPGTHIKKDSVVAQGTILKGEVS